MPSLNTKLATAPNTTSNYVLRATSSTTIGNSTIQDDGTNVAIGTTPGTYKLNVSGTGNFTGALSGTSATFSGNVMIGSGTAGRQLEIYNANDAYMKFNGQRVGNNAFTIGNDNSGFVVFDDTNAAYRLRIANNTGAATFSSSVSITDDAAFGGQAKLFSRITADATTVGKITDSSFHIWNTTTVGSLSQITFGYTNGSTTNASVYLGLITTNGSGSGFGDFVLGTAPSANVQFVERMRITSGGNVGIGTNSPHTLLTISGAASTVYGINLGTQTPNWPSVSRYIGIGNSNGSIATNSGFSGIEFGGPDSADEGYLAFHTHDNGVASGERMRITSGGNVLMGTTTDSAGVRLKVVGGIIGCLDVYNNTTGVGANLNIDANGFFARSTSSIKYKKNVENYTKGLAEVMQMRPVTYNSINETETQTYAGLIAEEIHDLGLTEFVQYAEDGSPDALSYSNMVSLLVKAIQEMNQTIQNQQQQINSLINR